MAAPFQASPSPHSPAVLCPSPFSLAYIRVQRCARGTWTYTHCLGNTTPRRREVGWRRERERVMREGRGKKKERRRRWRRRRRTLWLRAQKTRSGRSCERPSVTSSPPWRYSLSSLTSCWPPVPSLSLSVVSGIAPTPGGERQGVSPAQVRGRVVQDAGCQRDRK